MDPKVKQVTEDTISKGGILFQMFFDSHAPDAETVKNRLTQLFAGITKEEGVVYAVGEIEPPESENLNGKNVYSTSGEVKVLTKDLKSAFRLAFKYGPVYLEVLEPERRIVGFEELQDIMNDVAQNSYALSQYIIRNTLKGEALQNFLRNLKYREKLGEKLRKGDSDGSK